MSFLSTFKDLVWMLSRSTLQQMDTIIHQRMDLLGQDNVDVPDSILPLDVPFAVGGIPIEVKYLIFYFETKSHNNTADTNRQMVHFENTAYTARQMMYIENTLVGYIFRRGLFPAMVGNYLEQTGLSAGAYAKIADVSATELKRIRKGYNPSRSTILSMLENDPLILYLLPALGVTSIPVYCDN